MIERVMGNAWFGAPGENTQFHESNISQHTSLHAEHSTASCAPHILHAEHSTSARHRSPSVLGFLAQNIITFCCLYVCLFSLLLGALFRVFAKNYPEVTRETSTPNCGTQVLRTAPGGFGIRGGVWYPSEPLHIPRKPLRAMASARLTDCFPWTPPPLMHTGWASPSPCEA